MPVDEGKTDARTHTSRQRRRKQIERTTDERQKRREKDAPRGGRGVLQMNEEVRKVKEAPKKKDQNGGGGVSKDGDRPK